MASELEQIKERLGRVEILVHQINHQEHKGASTAISASPATCEKCGARLSSREKIAMLRICRRCRAENVAVLMQPGNEEEQSPIPTNRLERIREALDTIELLTLAKQYYTYTELQNLLQLPSTVLSRYVKGHVLPMGKRSRQIRTALFEAIKLGGYVADSLKELGVQAVARMNMNPRLLWFIVSHIVSLNAGRRITKVLTASEHGIPLATLTSHRLGLPLIVAAPQKCAGTESYIEAVLPSSEPYVRTVYLPSHALKKNDAVLIITDLLSDGAIQVALERIVEKTKATTAAIWATIVAADNWVKTRCPVEFLVKADVPLSQAWTEDTSPELEPVTHEEKARAV